MSGFNDPAMFTARCRRCRAWKPWAKDRKEIERVGDMHRRAYGHEFTVRVPKVPKRARSRVMDGIVKFDLRPLRSWIEQICKGQPDLKGFFPESWRP